MSNYVPLFMSCDFCHKKDPKWIYRYHEKIYCKQCFVDHFKIKECAKCGENKYIHYQLKEIPLCKICQIKDDPCIRCGREISCFGKIMKEGPVCASCSKYFREEKQCMVCYKHSREVFNRNYLGVSKPVCTSCHNKTFPSCSKCRRQREPFTYDFKRRPVCKMCSTNDRVCTDCGKGFPAGRGRICQECSSRNGLIKKIESAKGMLSSFFSEHFESFAFWLLERRGSQFASHHILFYLPWVQKLDQLSEKLDRLPTYTDIVSTFSVAETRQHLLLTRYLDENGVVKIDKDTQKLHADLDMIDRYLDVFSKKSGFGKMILAYHAYREEKHTAGTTSVRSMRLALTPAVRFFQYCEYGTEEKPSQALLESYLWCFYGQKSAITGFTLFLNREFGYSFIIKNIYRPVLERPKASRKYLEHRFLFILRNKESLSENEYEAFLRIAIGYLHRIDIPKYIKLGFCDIKKSPNGYQLRLAGEVFTLPEEIILHYKL